MSVELKKVKAEHAAVIAAKYDMEFQIEKFKEQIARLLKNVEIQEQKEIELEKKLKEIKGE